MPRWKVTQQVTLLDSPIQSPCDKKNYRIIKLHNGLTAILIEDYVKPSVKVSKPFVLESTSRNESNDEHSYTSLEGPENIPRSEKLNKRLNNKTAIRHFKPRSSAPVCNRRKPGKRDKKMSSAIREENLAAVALTVGVGSFCDPDSILGLAHLLEHVLFLGSKRYPEIGEFDIFLDKNGGSCNAWTDLEETTFQFKVNVDGLKQSMSRFAQFFIDPLLKPERIDKEIQIVDSEFCKTKQDDDERVIQVLKSMIRKNHPMSRFVDGSKKTLRETPSIFGLDLEKFLREFFNKYYCASNMTLAVQAGKSLDTLEKWVCELFSKIPEYGTVMMPDFSKDSFQLPYVNSLFCRPIKVTPVATINQLIVTWCLPSMRQNWEEKTTDFIYFLLTHDGYGSLGHYLKSRLWCVEILYGFGGGNFEDSSGSYMFSLSFSLTDEGQQRVLGILTALFFYINMLRNSEESELNLIYEERKQMSNILFTWQEDIDPVDNVEMLSVNLRRYPPHSILCGKQLLRRFDVQMLRRILEKLNPSEVNLMWVSPNFAPECTEKERWYDAMFTPWVDPSLGEWRDKMKTQWLQKTTIKEFHLPAANKYLASRFSILKEGEFTNVRAPPELLKENKFGKLWWKIDGSFQLPRSCLYFCLSPDVHLNPRVAAMLELFIEVLHIHLNSEFFEAATCDINVDIYTQLNSLVFEIEGFHHKLSTLWYSIVDELASFSVSEAVFASVCIERRRDLHNSATEPELLAEGLRSAIVNSQSVTSLEEMKIVKETTLESFTNFAKMILSHCYVEGFVFGNTSSEEALNMMQYIIERLHPIPPSQPPLPYQMRAMQLPVGSSFCRVKNLRADDVNGVVLNYYQFGKETTRRKIIAELLSNIMLDPLFRILRSKEQLGYDVSCEEVIENNSVGFIIRVNHEAHKFSAFHVNQRVEVFLKWFVERVRTMKMNTFQNHMWEIIGTRMSSATTMREAGNEFWLQILNGTYKFDYLEEEISVSDSIKKKELVNFTERVFLSTEQMFSQNQNLKVAQAVRWKRNNNTRNCGGRLINPAGYRIRVPHQATITERLFRVHQERKSYGIGVKHKHLNKNNSAPSNKNLKESRNESDGLEQSSASATTEQSKRKLSVHVMGHGTGGPSENAMTSRSGKTSANSDGSTVTDVDLKHNSIFELKLLFVDSKSLYPRSRHVFDIQEFKSGLYSLPVKKNKE